MKACKLLFFAMAAMILAGCAAAPLSQDVANDLKSGKIAVAYYQKEKRINYNELVYRVLWNEAREHDATFDGLWDIDTDLSNHMAPCVTKLGLNATSIHELVPQEELKVLHGNLLARDPFRDKEPVKMVLGESLRKALLDKQIDYLLTVDGDYIYIYTQIGVKQGSARTVLTLLDVRSNEQKYFATFPVAGFFEVEESAREIEDNNLAGLKHMLKEWLSTAVEQSMPKQLGLIQPKS